VFAVFEGITGNLKPVGTGKEAIINGSLCHFYYNIQTHQR
jgi:hypothetical protein